jgi:uncharacterized protein involved in exopolysaccharide biosynthesis
VQALDRLVQAAEFKSGIGAYAALGAAAVPPQTPAYPRPALNLGVGSALGLVLGLALATGRHALMGQAREPTGARAVGRIPEKA